MPHRILQEINSLSILLSCYLWSDSFRNHKELGLLLEVVVEAEGAVVAAAVDLLEEVLVVDEVEGLVEAEEDVVEDLEVEDSVVGEEGEEVSVGGVDEASIKKFV